ncbi:MAG TPA: hypothetical protein VIA09_04900 [Nitrososphaeraceae archaeon]
MKLDCLNTVTIFMVGLAVAAPIIFAGSANAQDQNMTPSMVINMSDLSIKIGNTTSNQTITFSNNTSNEAVNSTGSN